MNRQWKEGRQVKQTPKDSPTVVNHTFQPQLHRSCWMSPLVVAVGAALGLSWGDSGWEKHIGRMNQARKPRSGGRLDRPTSEGYTLTRQLNVYAIFGCVGASIGARGKCIR